MKTKTFLIITAVLAALAAVWYFFLRTDPKKETADQAKNTTIQEDTFTRALGHAEFPLKKGSKGVEVLYFQAYLNKIRSAEITDLDGIFGKETEREAKAHNNAGLSFVNRPFYDEMMKAYYPILKKYLQDKGLNIK